MITLGCDEDLRLVLEAPERLAVGDAVAIALEGAAQAARGSSTSLPRVCDERTARGDNRLASSASRRARRSRRQVPWFACARAILLEPIVDP
jgi:hypothetical protein